MPHPTIRPGHVTAAHRILSGRAPEIVESDRDRAARVVAAQLPWLAHLDDDERQTCLDEIVEVLLDREPTAALDQVIANWAKVAARRRAARASA